MRALIVVALAAALAGCGSSSDRTASVRSAPTTASPSTPPVPRLAAPCGSRARAALHRRPVRAEPFTASSGAAGCHLTAPGLDLVVELDSAPQAYVRMEREQVEYWQNVEWSHLPASASPRNVKHLGLDAYWFPRESRLLTTDGVRLITVKLRSPLGGPAERRALAERLARVYLGPLVKPPTRYGP